MSRRGSAGAFLIAAFTAACAQPTPPPGGPPDDTPPKLVSVTPESGSVRVRLREVVFQFDEVVSEQPGGAASLAQLVLISPSHGAPEVRWRRSSVAVRPRGGWRDSTTFVVTLLAGLADLRGNRRDSATVLVFSTGDSIPNTRLAGVVFDWARGDVAARALVQAHPSGDTALAYSAEADSLGRFVLPFLTPGEYVVRAILDVNRNRAVDAREPWDTVRVQLRDTSTVELYAFLRDSTAPRVTGVSLVDSVTIRVALDGPLSPGVMLAGIAEVLAPDSTPLIVTRVVPWTVLAAEREARELARRDSVVRADTSLAARTARDRQLRDSLNRAAAIADSIARDTAPRVARPTPARPRLVTELGLALAAPPAPGVVYRLRLRVTGVLGAESVVQRTFVRQRPDTTRQTPPRDTSAAASQAAGQPGPARTRRLH